MSLRWIATPAIPPDFRGPIDRPFRPLPHTATTPSIIDLLTRAAAEWPDRVVAADEHARLSYAELLSRSAGLAAAIGDAQPGRGAIGILLPPGCDYLVALYAVIATGRLCVLLDDGYPAERNADIARRTGIQLVVTSPAGPAPAWPGVSRIEVGRRVHPPGVAPALAASTISLDAPAFILCTSGSSGRPKAIVHSQRTLLHWARVTCAALHIAHDDCALTFASPSSLAGLNPMLCYPLVGASLQLVDLKAGGLRGLLAAMMAGGVTILRSHPSMLRSLVSVAAFPAAAAHLRLVQLSGEPLTKADLAGLRAALPPNCLVRTTYGATEASGLSWYAGDPDDYDPAQVASGVLLPDTEAAILDEAGDNCADGEAGELVIRSRYNALGEWVDGRVVPGETDPGDPGPRIFRTGDIARFHPHGVFVVLGRRDQMLKINGQRLEPAEIEAVLGRSPAVLLATTLLHHGRGAPRLVAFVVPRAGAWPDLAATLKADLQRSLPGFMVPRIVLIAAMPTLPGGKRDAAALLAMADRLIGGSDPARSP